MSRSLNLISLLLVLSIGLLAKDSYIQVVADPGISVFLDGELKGITSSEYGGLIIENVRTGIQTIRLVKTDFNPQEEEISVKSGEVFIYKVRPFIPKLKITETGNTGQQQIALKVGSLIVQSLPVNISISIPSLGVQYKKQKDEWKAEEIPEGKYFSTFSLKGKTLSDSIEIKNKQTTHLLVNMIGMKIENRAHQDVNPSEKRHNNKSSGSQRGPILPEQKATITALAAQNMFSSQGLEDYILRNYNCSLDNLTREDAESIISAFQSSHKPEPNTVIYD